MIPTRPEKRSKGGYLQGTLEILDGTGHKTLEWDTEVKDGPLDPAYVEQEFKKLVQGQGFFAFGTTEAGDSEQIKSFDPHEFPKVTLSPQYQGG